MYFKHSNKRPAPRPRAARAAPRDADGRESGSRRAPAPRCQLSLVSASCGLPRRKASARPATEIYLQVLTCGEVKETLRAGRFMYTLDTDRYFVLTQ